MVAADGAVRLIAVEPEAAGPASGALSSVPGVHGRTVDGG